MNSSPGLFRWQPCLATLVALLAGAAAIALSAALLLLKDAPVATAVVRDALQIGLLGVVLPLLRIARSDRGFAGYGLRFHRWRLMLAINLALALGLLLQFLKTVPVPPGFQLDATTFWKAAYVFLALAYELLFFYAFLRTEFERAFGAIPGILLAALFYAFHHIGFQPEFAKLFAVGVMYATVYRLGNSALSIFPFFLGVGGIYDVLIQSRVVAPIPLVEVRTVLLAAFAALALFASYRSSRNRDTTGGASPR